MASDYIENRGGSLYVAGTRVSLDSVVIAFQRGESPETIRQNFELLKLEEVYGAIAYYLANRAAVDTYLRGRDQDWDSASQTADPLPTDLRERLDRARNEAHAANAR